MLNMKGRQKQSKKSLVGGLDGNEKSTTVHLTPQPINQQSPLSKPGPYFPSACFHSLSLLLQRL